MRRPCIIVLGSGAAIPSHERFTASLLLSGLRTNILLDVGEGAQIRLSRIGFAISKINAVAITHMHGDHFLGLYPLLQSRALTAHGAGTGEQHSKMLIVAPEKVLCEALAEISGVECRVAEHGELITFADCNLVPLRMEHGDAKSFGYLAEVFVDGRKRRSVKVFYGGDGICPRETIEYLKRTGVDVAILDASFSALDMYKAMVSGHSTAMQSAIIASEIGARMLVLTHVSARYSDSDREALVSEARRFYGNMVVEAQDYTTIPLWLL